LREACRMDRQTRAGRFQANDGSWLRR
jgi:hypothetical protein